MREEGAADDCSDEEGADDEEDEEEEADEEEEDLERHPSEGYEAGGGRGRGWEARVAGVPTSCCNACFRTAGGAVVCEPSEPDPGWTLR